MKISLKVALAGLLCLVLSPFSYGASVAKPQQGSMLQPVQVHIPGLQLIQRIQECDAQIDALSKEYVRLEQQKKNHNKASYERQIAQVKKDVKVRQRTVTLYSNQLKSAANKEGRDAARSEKNLKTAQDVVTQLQAELASLQRKMEELRCYDARLAELAKKIGQLAQIRGAAVDEIENLKREHQTVLNNQQAQAAELAKMRKELEEAQKRAESVEKAVLELQRQAIVKATVPEPIKPVLAGPHYTGPGFLEIYKKFEDQQAAEREKIKAQQAAREQQEREAELKRQKEAADKETAERTAKIAEEQRMAAEQAKIKAQQQQAAQALLEQQKRLEADKREQEEKIRVQHAAAQAAREQQEREAEAKRQQDLSAVALAKEEVADKAAEKKADQQAGRQDLNDSSLTTAFTGFDFITPALEEEARIAAEQENSKAQQAAAQATQQAVQQRTVQSFTGMDLINMVAAEEKRNVAEEVAKAAKNINQRAKVVQSSQHEKDCALMLAARNFHSAGMKAALDLGANINAMYPDIQQGDTPLMAFIRSGLNRGYADSYANICDFWLDVVWLLLHGASSDQINCKGESARSLVEHNDQHLLLVMDIVKILTNPTRQVPVPNKASDAHLLTVAYHGVIRAMGQQLQNGANINAMCPDIQHGDTPLMAFIRGAARNSKLQQADTWINILELMLWGANPDIANNNGETARSLVQGNSRITDLINFLCPLNHKQGKSAAADQEAAQKAVMRKQQDGWDQEPQHKPVAPKKVKAIQQLAPLSAGERQKYLDAETKYQKEVAEQEVATKETAIREQQERREQEQRKQQQVLENKRKKEAEFKAAAEQKNKQLQEEEERKKQEAVAQARDQRERAKVARELAAQQQAEDAPRKKELQAKKEIEDRNALQAEKQRAKDARAAQRKQRGLTAQERAKKREESPAQGVASAWKLLATLYPGTSDPAQEAYKKEMDAVNAQASVEQQIAAERARKHKEQMEQEQQKKALANEAAKKAQQEKINAQQEALAKRDKEAEAKKMAAMHKKQERTRRKAQNQAQAKAAREQYAMSCATRLKSSWADTVEECTKAAQKSLFCFAYLGDIDGIKMALADGADINAYRKNNRSGDTPLMAALVGGCDSIGNPNACQKHMEAIKFLINRGAHAFGRIRSEDRGRTTPLMQTLLRGFSDIGNAQRCNHHMQAIELLLDRGAHTFKDATRTKAVSVTRAAPARAPVQGSAVHSRSLLARLTCSRASVLGVQNRRSFLGNSTPGLQTLATAALKTGKSFVKK